MSGETYQGLETQLLGYLNTAIVAADNVRDSEPYVSDSVLALATPLANASQLVARIQSQKRARLMEVDEDRFSAVIQHRRRVEQYCRIYGRDRRWYIRNDPARLDYADTIRPLIDAFE